MKIYRSPDKLVIQGKAWEVMHMLKFYRKHYPTLQALTDDTNHKKG
ncbi:hypothetical protein HNR44_000912 [Geomicrobium halophilum]|uniref:Z-ring formation inhibitor MciZ n=1 Tax=Geomicrobium halophilum TaxID=549000 RepID=A0A841PX37_9BACL|nr:hypothetical protein [Geomicrobium halophilum]